MVSSIPCATLKRREEEEEEEEEEESEWERRHAPGAEVGGMEMGDALMPGAYSKGDKQLVSITVIWRSVDYYPRGVMKFRALGITVCIQVPLLEEGSRARAR